MAAYFTRAVPRPSGYYRELNNCSTADVDLIRAKPTADISIADDVYEVKRLVQSRRGNALSLLL